MRRPRWSEQHDVQLADMLVHEAGHAVVAWELGIKIVALRFSAKDWTGRMHFAGGMYGFEGDLASERAREEAEKDMLIFHAGLMAQRLFHYDGSHDYQNTIDLKGLMDTAQMVEHDIDLIDEWSDYIEERVRVMLSQPATWQRVIALAQEIARRLYLPGSEIAAFLRGVDVTQAVSPKDRLWKRSEYPLGLAVDALALSNRARSCLNRAEIETVAELLTYSAWDLRSSIWRVGAKTTSEIERAVQDLGLALAEKPRYDRESRVDRARRGEVPLRAYDGTAGVLGGS